MKLTRELVRQFEDHLAGHSESLMRASLTAPGNSQGYAFYRDGTIRAHCSTNPYAAWATCAYHLNQQTAEKVRAAIAFFREHHVPAKVRIVPDGFNPAQADVLTELGLRHIGFHTILWSPLPACGETDQRIDIREATSPEQIDAHIRIQVSAHGVPENMIDSFLPLRRPWWNLPQLKFYLAYVDGVPAAQAILDCNGEIAYLAAAGTLPAYRRRGLQTALVRRRLLDAQNRGCKVVFGASDFENNSRTNQMAAGLQVAYTAAWWIERGGTLG